MTFTKGPHPIHSYGDLPAEGILLPTAQERAWLDFKLTVAPDRPHEMAKDIAALCNFFGGTILVGVRDENGHIGFEGMSPLHCHTLKQVYDQAAKDWCSPAPDPNSTVVGLPGGVKALLAVNVPAHVGGLVGAAATVRTRKSETTERNRDAWLFPIRRGSHTGYLRPEELPMYFDGHRRSVALRLMRIPSTGSPLVRLYFAPSERRNTVAGPFALDEYLGEFQGVELDDNSATFAIKSKGEQPLVGAVPVPLGDIEDVWKGAGFWCVRVRGRLAFKGNPPQPDRYEPVY